MMKELRIRLKIWTLTDGDVLFEEFIDEYGDYWTTADM